MSRQDSASKNDSKAVLRRPSSLRVAISPRTARLSASSGSSRASSWKVNTKKNEPPLRGTIFFGEGHGHSYFFLAIELHNCTQVGPSIFLERFNVVSFLCFGGLPSFETNAPLLNFYRSEFSLPERPMLFGPRSPRQTSSKALHSQLCRWWSRLGDFVTSWDSDSERLGKCMMGTISKHTSIPFQINLINDMCHLSTSLSPPLSLYTYYV